MQHDFACESLFILFVPEENLIKLHLKRGLWFGFSRFYLSNQNILTVWHRTNSPAADCYLPIEILLKSL